MDEPSFAAYPYPPVQMWAMRGTGRVPGIFACGDVHSAPGIEPAKISAGAQAGRSSLEGRSNAAPSPMSPNRTRETIAQAYDRYPGATTDTMIVPAIAVPKDEPRLETLRESPEISPCSASGKLD
jgi:hypothetical protein